MAQFANESDFLNDGDGFSALQIFRNPKIVQAYTYDDIILMPGHVQCEAKNITLDSRITKKIALR